MCWKKKDQSKKNASRNSIIWFRRDMVGIPSCFRHAVDLLLIIPPLNDSISLDIIKNTINSTCSIDDGIENMEHFCCLAILLKSTLQSYRRCSYCFSKWWILFLEQYLFANSFIRWWKYLWCGKSISSNFDIYIYFQDRTLWLTKKHPSTVSSCISDPFSL